VAEEKLGTLGLIAHNVTHEVRNHLSAIRMSLYMLEKGCDAEHGSPDQRLHFSIAREELNRIELFLRTLANYARPPRPRFAPSNLVEVVNKGLEDARPALILKSVALFRQFPQISPIIPLDPVQFAQAVTQVVENASQAMERQGEVHVVIKRQPADDGTRWLVEIRDNGPGVAHHLRERVFEPFFSTTSQHLGLGLSNVKRILELHDGEVLFSSTPGRGTVVILRVPETRDRETAARDGDSP
jgi:signal transduction histidine kinase